MSSELAWFRRVADFHQFRLGGDPSLWSSRWPGVRVELHLRELWRGHIWTNREDHRIYFGWGDGYTHEVVSVWIRYWPTSKAKSEELPF
jgi:hypothetical protein